MDKFKDLNELRTVFIAGNLATLPDTISVSDVQYRLRTATNHTIDTMIRQKLKGVVVYSCGRQNVEQARSKQLEMWILLIWSFNSKLHMLPYDVRTISESRGRPTISSLKEQQDQQVLPDIIEIEFTSFPDSKPIKGKVDTGATISSLHADRWDITDSTVSFVNTDLSPNIITVPIKNKQAVKTADGGIEYRPVIELTISINGKQIKNAMFNLNDRSEMDYPVLVGQNILERGDFLVDPTAIKEENVSESNESIDWDLVYEAIQDDEIANDINDRNLAIRLADLNQRQFQIRDLIELLQQVK